MMAVRDRRLDMVKLLLSAGANVEAANAVILIIHFIMTVTLLMVLLIIFCDQDSK